MRADRFGDALATAPSFELLAGSSIVFFSFLGFENIANLAAEAKDPGRALPRAILISLCAAILMYALVALAVVALSEPQALAESDAPLATAVRRASPQLAGALGGIALFATANTALASIISGSRVLLGMAEARELPRALSAVLAGRKTPWVATMVTAAIAGLLLPLGSVGTVASVSSFAALVAFTLVNVAVVLLRRAQPDLKRPFRTPLAVARVPVLPVLGALFSCVLMVRLEPTAIALGTGTAIALAGARAAFRARKIPATAK
jgi:amino acid transporter